MINFNTERTAKSTAKFNKELRVSIDIIGSNGEPTTVNLGYLALFENNDVLQAIADMDDVQSLASKLKLAVQEAGLRQERAKRTVTFA
ncbi:hypothetical protein MOVS_05160 [Moraxella ovis]|uniref:Uncharacterized protein n=1 Tax=Moraxella ovis TaxID=29433 RepID=A0A378PK01_9GAMM|nr:hypothetical protein [Moraxella ovis]ANB91468.1 hypothetical protein MOVS_05160 [Moraxella ovis]STY87084.1 Uncharacterised protein [Moraxella ovis]